MNVRVNPQFVRLALACIQPASPLDVVSFTQSTFRDGSPRHEIIEHKDVRQLFSEWYAEGDIVCVHKRLQLYSLTKQGDGRLTKAERFLRDRTRLFLLKELRARARLKTPEAGCIEKADASSAESIDPVTQEDERPIGAADSPRQARRVGRAYWPLLSKQHFVGSSSPASGPKLRFLSFQSEGACAKACGHVDSIQDGLGPSEFALAIGVSPRLIGHFLHKPERHYRTFEIPKGDGTARIITAPRTMLKVVQYFILDYLLGQLSVHIASTAYLKGCSTRENAARHVGKKYVANIDISNFFPSLKSDVVFSKLLAGGMKVNTARLVARLCSYGGGLPQGAPTSPALANIALFEFDQTLSDYCDTVEVAYTRYADDISFSGDDRGAVVAAIDIARKGIQSLGLELNDSKTRVVGPASRQMVTGVVVNVWPQPSRSDRRKLRAALHQALLNPGAFAEQLNVLQGRASYMLSFSREDRAIGALPHSYVRAAIDAVRTYREHAFRK